MTNIKDNELTLLKLWLMSKVCYIRNKRKIQNNKKIFEFINYIPQKVKS